MPWVVVWKHTTAKSHCKSSVRPSDVCWCMEHRWNASTKCVLHFRGWTAVIEYRCATSEDISPDPLVVDTAYKDRVLSASYSRGKSCTACSKRASQICYCLSSGKRPPSSKNHQQLHGWPTSTCKRIKRQWRRKGGAPIFLGMLVLSIARRIFFPHALENARGLR